MMSLPYPRGGCDMPEMSTARLMKMCEKYYHAHRALKDAEADKETLSPKIITELKRRGTKALDAMGWKVNHVVQMMTVYDTDEARRRLTKAKFMAVTERVVTSDAVAAALSEGKITERELARFSKRVPKSSYILVNPASDPGA
jgi:hypothetical protein